MSAKGWTKTVLIFQAVVTLIIGMTFFSQVVTLDEASIDKLNIEITSPNLFDDESETIFVDLKKRYTKASYILIIVALIEFILLSRAFR